MAAVKVQVDDLRLDSVTGSFNDTLRALIREELSQGLGVFRETVRDLLQIELQVRPREPSKDVMRLESNSLRQAGVSQPFARDLPGAVVEKEDSCQSLCQTSNSLRLAPPSANEARASSGSICKDDSVVYQKCGTKRLGCTHQCSSCGKTFTGDGAFCRMCGQRRPSVSSECGEETMVTTTSSGNVDSKTGKKKKRKNHKACLFKQSTEAHEPLTKLQKFTSSKSYEVFSGVLIVTNAFFLGWQTQFLAEYIRDHALRNEPLPDKPPAFTVIRILYCILFTIELGLRWKADGIRDFFKTAEVTWNILDVVVVGSSLLELLMDVISLASGMQKSDALENVAVLRVLRVVRVVRVARVIRVTKFFRELRMMIYSILGCVKNLFWVLIVLMMTFYVFAVMFTSAVVDYLDTTQKWNDPHYEYLLKYFGTIDKCILSLFMSMSGGNDWSAYYEALEIIGMPYTAAFLLFIVFSLFAVVNIVTGVFVESALQSNIKDRDIVVHEEMQAKKTYLRQMEEIFEEMDEDGKGTISMDEFETKLKDERVIAYFSVLKLDVSDARILFQLLDHDQSDEVGIDEFLDGCYRLQGESRALDVKIMQYEIRFLKERFESFNRVLDDVESQTSYIAKAAKPTMASRDHRMEPPGFPMASREHRVEPPGFLDTPDSKNEK